VCAQTNKNAQLIAQKNPRTLKRFIRCENYEECNTGDPLPQYGALTATEEVCEHCGAPMVIVTTNRGPWKLCPNFECPSKADDAKAKTGKTKAGAKGSKGVASSKAGAKSAGKAKATAKSAKAAAGAKSAKSAAGAKSAKAAAPKTKRS
jgi:DNA topoisomerase-1